MVKYSVAKEVRTYSKLDDARKAAIKYVMEHGLQKVAIMSYEGRMPYHYGDVIVHYAYSNPDWDIYMWKPMIYKGTVGRSGDTRQLTKSGKLKRF